MTLLQCILIGFIYWMGTNQMAVSYTGWARPIVGGFFAGLILGDPVKGAIIGANINLIYIGVIGAGGATPGDIALAGTVATAFAVAYDYDVNTALALAVPLGVVGNVLSPILMTACTMFVHMTQSALEKYNFKSLLWTALLLPMFFRILVLHVPVVILMYLGSGFLDQLINSLPAWVTSAFSAIGGLLPAAGIAVNLSAIYKGKARPFLFIGFVIAAYTTLPVIATAILGTAAAFIYLSLETTLEKSSTQ